MLTLTGNSIARGGYYRTEKFTHAAVAATVASKMAGAGFGDDIVSAIGFLTAVAARRER